MKHSIFLVTALSAAITLTSCNIADQDGDGTDSRASLNGLVVDGRIAGGEVWVDMNNDFEINDFEPSAYTDNQGYYSYNPESGIDYCALPESDNSYRYCLEYSNTEDSITIRIQGGIDLATGEELKGLMAMSSTISESSQKSSTPLVLSPITTVLSAATDETERQKILTTLNLTEEDLSVDFSEADTPIRQAMLANAIAIQSMIDVLFSAADDDTFETQIQEEVIATIAANIIEESTAPIDFTAETLTSLVAGVSVNSTQQTTVASRLKTLNNMVSKIADTTDEETISNTIKATEVISQLIREEASNDDDASAASKVLGDANDDADTSISDLVSALTSTFDSQKEYDVASITKTLISAGEEAIDNDSSIDTSNAVSEAIIDSTLAIGNWGGNWFVLQPTGENADELEEGSYIAVYLSGDNETESGSIAVCVNASAADSNDPDEELINEYMSGTWSKITEGIVTLVIDYEGQEFEGTMKSKGDSIYRFSTDIEDIDEDGDAISLEAAVTAISSAEIPESADECASDIDSEIQAIL